MTFLQKVEAKPSENVTPADVREQAGKAWVRAFRTEGRASAKALRYDRAWLAALLTLATAWELATIPHTAHLELLLFSAMSSQFIPVAPCAAVAGTDGAPQPLGWL